MLAEMNRKKVATASHKAAEHYDEEARGKNTADLEGVDKVAFQRKRDVCRTMSAVAAAAEGNTVSMSPAEFDLIRDFWS